MAKGYDALNLIYDYMAGHNGKISEANKKGIKAKYTKEGKYKVTLNKTGYKSVTKTVKVYSGDKPKSNKENNSYKNNDSKKKITLTCPSIAGVNEWFKCSANLSGVKISVSSVGFTGNVLSYTTTSSDKVKDLRYNKAGTITVTASKSGYSTVKKTVVVK